MKVKFFIWFVLILTIFRANSQPEKNTITVPRSYKVKRVTTPVIIDGKLNDTAWMDTPWTEDFVDIEGELKPQPLFRTRAKMVFDDQYLYIGAELEEPHIWATCTEDESIIYHDNDFEVFIDPDGDGQLYYELEINALGTKWDLLLTKPYREGGIYISSWEIRGLKKAVFLDGTINDPSDTDRFWNAELALPWEVLRECAPGRRKPEPGVTWRINFSRVEWKTELTEGKYVKMKNPETGRNFPESNWVWSPQGVINMHRPEKWGFLEFTE